MFLLIIPRPQLTLLTIRVICSDRESIADIEIPKCFADSDFSIAT